MFFFYKDKSHYLFPAGRKTFIRIGITLHKFVTVRVTKLLSPLNYFVNYLCHLTNEGSKIYNKQWFDTEINEPYGFESAHAL